VLHYDFNCAIVIFSNAHTHVFISTRYSNINYSIKFVNSFPKRHILSLVIFKRFNIILLLCFYFRLSRMISSVAMLPSILAIGIFLQTLIPGKIIIVNNNTHINFFLSNNLVGKNNQNQII